MFVSAAARHDPTPFTFVDSADASDSFVIAESAHSFSQSLTEIMNNSYGSRGGPPDNQGWARSQDERFANFYNTPRAEGNRVLPPPASSLVMGSSSIYAPSSEHGNGLPPQSHPIYPVATGSSSRQEHFASHEIMSSPIQEQHSFMHPAASPSLSAEPFSANYTRQPAMPTGNFPMSSQSAGHHYDQAYHASPMYMQGHQSSHGHLPQPGYRPYDAPSTHPGPHGYTGDTPGPMFPYGPPSSSFAHRSHYLNPFEVKHRRRTTKSQFQVLEGTFKEIPKPNAALRKALSVQLDMPPRAVQIWFQNRRAKAKAMARKEATTKDSTDDASKTGAGPSSSSNQRDASTLHGDEGSMSRGESSGPSHSTTDASFSGSSSIMTGYSHGAPSISTSSTVSDDGLGADPSQYAHMGFQGYPRDKMPLSSPAITSPSSEQNRFFGSHDSPMTRSSEQSSNYIQGRPPGMGFGEGPSYDTPSSSSVHDFHSSRMHLRRQETEGLHNHQVYPAGLPSTSLSSSTDSPLFPSSYSTERRASCPDTTVEMHHGHSSSTASSAYDGNQQHHIMRKDW